MNRVFRILLPLLVVTLAVAWQAPKSVRVGGNVAAANLVRQIAPKYPVAMKAQGLEAGVMLSVVISAEGVPTSISVQDPSVPREFSDAAIEAVKEWRYKPTLLNGEPVEVITSIQINFTLAK